MNDSIEKDKGSSTTKQKEDNITNTLADGVTPVNDNDVLFGRGSVLLFHPGNIEYRRVIKSHRKEYISAGRDFKRGVAEKVIALVAGKGSRFLKRRAEDRECYVWDEVSAENAIEKVKQSLREKPREHRKATAAKRKQAPSYEQEQPHQQRPNSAAWRADPASAPSPSMASTSPMVLPSNPLLQAPFMQSRQPSAPAGHFLLPAPQPNISTFYTALGVVSQFHHHHHHPPLLSSSDAWPMMTEEQRLLFTAAQEAAAHEQQQKQRAAAASTAIDWTPQAAMRETSANNSDKPQVTHVPQSVQAPPAAMAHDAVLVNGTTTSIDQSAQALLQELIAKKQKQQQFPNTRAQEEKRTNNTIDWSTLDIAVPHDHTSAVPRDHSSAIVNNGTEDTTIDSIANEAIANALSEANEAPPQDDTVELFPDQQALDRIRQRQQEKYQQAMARYNNGE